MSWVEVDEVTDMSCEDWGEDDSTVSSAEVLRWVLGVVVVLEECFLLAEEEDDEVEAAAAAAEPEPEDDPRSPCEGALSLSREEVAVVVLDIRERYRV